MESTAASVIKKFGGVRALARAIDVNPSTVSRWTMPREKGGAAGRIPAKAQPLVIEAAKKAGIKLTIAREPLIKS